MHTAFGGSRVVDMLIGDPLPRICYLVSSLPVGPWLATLWRVADVAQG